MLSTVAGNKPFWLHGEVKTPPFSGTARIEAGFLLRRLQNGELLQLPSSRPMPTIGSKCHELRVVDGAVTWRIAYYLDANAVVILEVFQKKSRTTPKHVIEVAQRRLRAYQRAVQED
jgi:phage-related protein